MVLAGRLCRVEGRFARLPPPSHQQTLLCSLPPVRGVSSRFLFSLFVLFRYDSPALADAMFRGAPKWSMVRTGVAPNERGFSK